MRLRSFIAHDMAEALAMVRREMGPDAIILSSERTAGGNLEVRAAVEEAGEPLVSLTPVPQPVSQPSGVAEFPVSDPEADAADAEAVFGFHGAPPDLARALARSAAAMGETQPVPALALALETRFSFRPIQSQGRRPVLLVGPPGAGKSSACGKLAARAALAGSPARLICADSARAGAREQLESYAEASRADFVFAGDDEALRQAALEGGDRLTLIDAAGSNSCDPEDLTHIGALARAAAAEPVLVLDAGMAAEEAASLARAYARIGARRLILTKLDAVRRRGGGLAAADAAGLAFAHVSASPYLVGGFAPATPLRLARLLLEDAEPEHAAPQADGAMTQAVA